MDDVLLDTSNYVIKWHNKQWPFGEEKNCGSRDIHNILNMSWEECWNNLPVEFWESIPFCPWAKQLIELGEYYFPNEVYLLTSPIPNGVCSMGKHFWVNKYMPNYSNRIIIGHKKHACVGENGLLIDDSYLNEDKFIEYGLTDSFYLFPSYQNKLYKRAAEIYKQPEAIVLEIKELLEKCQNS